MHDEQVILRKNERDEWELPGGRIELGETPEQCVTRRVAAETHQVVTTGPVLDAWIYDVLPGRYVFVVVYGCHLTGEADAAPSNEHNVIDLFTQHQVADLAIPEKYKRSIAMWFDQQHDGIPETAGGVS